MLELKRQRQNLHWKYRGVPERGAAEIEAINRKIEELGARRRSL